MMVPHGDRPRFGVVQFSSEIMWNMGASPYRVAGPSMIGNNILPLSTITFDRVRNRASCVCVGLVVRGGGGYAMDSVFLDSTKWGSGPCKRDYKQGCGWVKVSFSRPLGLVSDG